MRFRFLFLAYLCIEVILAVLVIWAIGWIAVIILTFAGIVFGIVIMQNAGFQASNTLREANATGTLPEGKMGDSSVLFIAGLLIAIPGFLTDLIGLLLLIPPIRKLGRRVTTSFIAARLRTQGMSVVTVTENGQTTTRVVPGDVVTGDVLKRTDAAPDTPQGPDSGPKPQLPGPRDGS